MNFDGFNTRNEVLTEKLLKQGYRCHKLCTTLSNLFGGILTNCLNIMSDLKYFFYKAIRNLNFMAIWYINLNKIIGKTDFPYHF